MRMLLESLSLVLLVALAAVGIALAADPIDSDGDGVVDSADNCLGVQNADQLDTDQDGYGNRCDSDYSNNGIVDEPDRTALFVAFGSKPGDENWNPDCDCNGDGVVGGPDFGCFAAYRDLPPGPSGLACAGTIPCP
jgi:hypothetical protein